MQIDGLVLSGFLVIEQIQRVRDAKGAASADFELCLIHDGRWLIYLVILILFHEFGPPRHGANAM